MKASTESRTLLVSIHDVSPVWEDRILRLVSLLSECGIRQGSLLVVPNFHGEWPLDAFPAFCRDLRGLLEAGWEAVLHGFTHLDQREQPPSGWWNRFLARHLTEGEGEFLSLGQEAISTRLLEGQSILRRTLGQSPAGFVAPAWLYDEVLLEHLGRLGFRYTERHSSLIDLARQREYLAPVAAWASRTRVRRWSSLAWARLAPPLLARLPLARVALHPKDIDHRRLTESIRRVLHRFLKAGYRNLTYSEFLNQG